jgi:LacI family transcriptional regulator
MAKRATAAEVAELAGVSRTTVSFVLNNVPGMRISEETRQRVILAAQKLNYHPDATARRMVMGQTHVIGFVLRQNPDQVGADHFLPQVLNGISQASASHGYHVLFEVIPPGDKSGAYMRLLNERHVDGIVLSGPRFDDIELLNVHIRGAPVVMLGQLPNSRIPYVDVNNIGGAQQATDHLIREGYQRIAMITNAPLDYTAAADRLAGYQQSLMLSNIPYDEALVRYGKFSPESGFDAMSELLELEPRPEAVFVASDTVALGALRAIRQHGLRIPEDIALCGFDDISLSKFIDPPLTTVALPAFGLGWGAAELVVRLIAAEDVMNPYLILDTELMIRQSSRKP